MDNTYLNVLSAPNRNGEQERVATYLLGIHDKTIKGLQALAAKDYPGSDCLVLQEAEQAVLTDTQIKHVVKEGKVVEAMPYVPTEEEIKAEQRAQLDVEYKAAKDELQSQYITALISGNTDATASIQRDAADVDASYVEQLKELM